MTRSEEEIDAVLNKCSESIEAGRSAWPGMTFEQGVDAALRWVNGDTDETPMED